MIGYFGIVPAVRPSVQLIRTDRHIFPHPPDYTLQHFPLGTVDFRDRRWWRTCDQIHFHIRIPYLLFKLFADRFRRVSFEHANIHPNCRAVRKDIECAPALEDNDCCRGPDHCIEARSENGCRSLNCRFKQFCMRKCRPLVNRHLLRNLTEHQTDRCGQTRGKRIFLQTHRSLCKLSDCCMTRRSRRVSAFRPYRQHVVRGSLLCNSDHGRLFLKSGQTLGNHRPAFIQDKCRSDSFPLQRIHNIPRCLTAYFLLAAKGEVQVIFRYPALRQSPICSFHD